MFDLISKDFNIRVFAFLMWDPLFRIPTPAQILRQRKGAVFKSIFRDLKFGGFRRQTSKKVILEYQLDDFDANIELMKNQNFPLLFI